MNPHSHSDAERTKKIQNKAIVNESPTDKLIRELKEENARLMKLLGQGDGDAGETEKLLAANTREMESINVSWEQRLREERMLWEKQMQLQKGATFMDQGPHLMNINEDPQVSTCHDTHARDLTPPCIPS